MTRDLRASLEATQAELKVTRASLADDASPGFVDQRRTLQEAVDTQRQALAPFEAAFAQLEARKATLEGEVSVLSVRAQSRSLNTSAGAIVVVGGFGIIAGMLYLASWLAANPAPAEPVALALAMVPAFTLGLVARARLFVG